MEHALLAQAFVVENKDVIKCVNIVDNLMTFHAHNGLMCPFRLPTEACDIEEEFFKTALYALTRNV